MPALATIPNQKPGERTRFFAVSFVESLERGVWYCEDGTFNGVRAFPPMKSHWMRIGPVLRYLVKTGHLQETPVFEGYLTQKYRRLK